MFILTGIGKIHDKLCMIIANDGAFKGGTVFPYYTQETAEISRDRSAEQNSLCIPCRFWRSFSSTSGKLVRPPWTSAMSLASQVEIKGWSRLEADHLLILLLGLGCKCAHDSQAPPMHIHLGNLSV